MNHRPIITLSLIIGFFTLVRVIISTKTGLGVDEAHYALYGKFLALSYLDHPPLVGWIEGLFLKLFGMSELTVRMPSILLSILDSYLIYELMGKITKEETAKLMAVVGINSSFLLFVLSFMFLPDSLLLPLSIGIVLISVKILKSGNTENYLLLGILLGLSGLSKYTAILFIPPLLAFVLLKKRTDVIFTPKILLTIIIGILFITPVIYWNYTHSFISFQYQFGHVIKHGIHWLDFFRSMAYQFGAYSPFYFILAIYGLVRSLKSNNDFALLSALIGGFILVFFVYASLTSTTLPHWDSVFYMLMIPTGIVFALESKKLRTFVKASVYITVLAFLFASSVLVFQYIRFPKDKSPFRDLFGYPTIMNTANHLLSKDKNTKKAIAVEHWTFGSRTMFYNMKDGFKSSVYVMQNKIDQFMLWEKKKLKELRGYDLLFIIFSYENKPLKEYAKCRRYKLVKLMHIKVQGQELYSVKFEWCYDFEGLK